MNKETLLELNRLWEPVRPYLVRQISELYGRNTGNVLEIGPFACLSFDLAHRKVGTSFFMAVFPEDIVDSLRQEARALGFEDKILIRASDEKLSGIPSENFDLIIYRGAFFFPTFFRPDLLAIFSSLRTGGIAVIGGGFGRYTPKDSMERIGKRSIELNQQLGRVRVNKNDLRSMLRSSGLEQKAEITEEGGLWVVLRK